jgi:hypothetical protein
MFDRNTFLRSYVLLFREGDALTVDNTGLANNAGAIVGALSSESILPHADDENWIDVRTIEEWDDAITESEKAVRRGLPGGSVKESVITLEQDLDLNFKTNRMTRIAWELFYRTATKLAGAAFQFVPLSGSPRNCWVMVQRFNHLHELVFAANLYCYTKVKDGVSGKSGDLIMPNFNCQLLYSQLNTMAGGDNLAA